MTPPQDFHESRHDGQNRVEPQALDVLSPITSQKAYTGPERRSSMRLWQEKVDRRLKAGDARMQALAAALDANTTATAEIKTDTGELVDLLHSVKGAFRVLDMLARLARPLGFLAAAFASFYALVTAFKTGGKL